MAIEVLVRGAQAKYRTVCSKCYSVLLWTRDDAESFELVSLHGSPDRITYTIICPACNHSISNII